MKTIVVAVPSGDIVHADFAMSLALLMSYSSDLYGVKVIALLNQRSSIVEKGRHEIVENALNLKSDYILFLDSDMVFPPDTLQRLYQKEKDIIGCNYKRRNEPYTDTIKYNEAFGRTGVVPVEGIGTGCLLVATEVFKKIGQPYFSVVWDGEQFKGEDYGFCERARNAGYEVFCDFNLSKQIQHIGTVKI